MQQYDFVRTSELILAECTPAGALVESRGWNIYGSKLVKLPTPQYVVFCNGKKDVEDKRILRLSDAFEQKDVKGCLECEALMININAGHNQEIMEKCHRLKDYSLFIAEIKLLLSEGDALENAVDRAVDNCIERDILKDILAKNRGEVKSMLLTEYNEEKMKEAMKEEGREEGFEEGVKLTKYIFKMYKEGKTPEEIAAANNLSIEKVNEILE